MSLPEFCHCGRTPAAVVLSVIADVIGLCVKLLVLSVKCYGRCNTAFNRLKIMRGVNGMGATAWVAPLIRHCMLAFRL
jgi:hypothetical protein